MSTTSDVFISDAEMKQREPASDARWFMASYLELKGSDKKVSGLELPSPFFSITRFYFYYSKGLKTLACIFKAVGNFVPEKGCGYCQGSCPSTRSIHSEREERKKTTQNAFWHPWILQHLGRSQGSLLCFARMLCLF